MYRSKEDQWYHDQCIGLIKDFAREDRVTQIVSIVTQIVTDPVMIKCTDLVKTSTYILAYIVQYNSANEKRNGVSIDTYQLKRRSNMNGYQRELQRLKPHDEVQDCHTWENTKGYTFIITAGHGYLVVPKNDKYASIAKQICDYGYEGELAYYLEEDCEAGKFIDTITTNT